MDISEVERMDWRNDQEFVAASHKMQRLRTRGEEIEQRMSELRQLVADHEQELVQVRASILLSESPEGADDPIQHQLVSCREELGRLAVEAAPIASAVTKLQQTLKDIERQAKVRMARPVEATIRATVQALAACLDHAAELNSSFIGFTGIAKNKTSNLPWPARRRSDCSMLIRPGASSPNRLGNQARSFARGAGMWRRCYLIEWPKSLRPSLITMKGCA